MDRPLSGSSLNDTGASGYFDATESSWWTVDHAAMTYRTEVSHARGPNNRRNSEGGLDADGVYDREPDRRDTEPAFRNSLCPRKGVDNQDARCSIFIGVAFGNGNSDPR